ncbi:MAG: major facilitator transporter [Candidatus Saccharibacteria bacterium]|nr:major facilitator transporter [Candidatus Saccharibacteria bacterium]
MDRYKENAKWLMYFAPFRNLSISAAFLTPFFLERGLSLSQVFLLQSIFSIASVLWELPSGMIADRYGRAFSIKLSAPIAVVVFTAYGFSNQFWQFAIWELMLAIANGLISGIDTALLLDSLKADGREHEYVTLSQRINAWGFASTAAGVPVAIALVHFVSLRSTLVADGLLTLVGNYFAFKLVEAPRFNGSQEAVRLSAWHAMRRLGRNAEARWLVVLGSALATSTYLAFWLAAPYYTRMGVPVVLFSVILAIRSLWKAWLSRRFIQERHIERNMLVYASLAGLVYLAMATGQLWLIWLVLGHDVVQALHAQPLTSQLNLHIDHEFRATMNSLVNLIERLVYSLAGPLVGWLVDRRGLATGFVVTGLVCSITAFVAIARLHRLKTFEIRR